MTIERSVNVHRARGPDPTLAARIVGAGSLHYIDGRDLYAALGRTILKGTVGQGFQTLARLPTTFGARVSASSRPLARLLRSHVSHIERLGDSLAVVGFGRIWCLHHDSGELMGQPATVVGSRPLALCAAPDGLYYGEYRDNSERSPVHVMFSADGLDWTTAHEFRGVRHIHGVYHDPYADAFWITTGDADAESAIWRSDDRFASVRRVLGGSQQVRAIGLLFTHAHVYFGSDTPDEANHLYRLDRITGEVHRLRRVEGSVFHAARAGDWMLFSTAVEPSSRNRSKDAVLYGSRDGETWHEMARHSKDAWALRYFQYGQLLLPSGDNLTGRYWYSAFAVNGDNHIYEGSFDVQP